MAKKATKKKESLPMEEMLWKACDALRGSIEPSEYKHVVLSLIFLKYAGFHFEKRRQEIIADGLADFVDCVEFYAAKNVFYLPETSRWSYLKENAKQPDIASKVDKALADIEKENKPLQGALPNNYYSSLGIEAEKLGSLLDKIDGFDDILASADGNDIIGRVYEYFLSKFAIKEGKGKGEFYTPKTIVNLIAEMIEPYEGKIYDPCCGSGGMFVQSLKFVESHNGNRRKVSVYGQEFTKTTFKLAKMNLAIRGIAADLGEYAANTFTDDRHKDLKADFIMANPPFNQKDWRANNQLTDDPRWIGYDTPPTSNANYGWILNMVSKLSANGVAGFILANGALSADGVEGAIRRKMIENDLVESIVILPRNLFYSTDISVTLWILNKNKKARVVNRNGKEIHYRDREGEILFIDMRQMGEPFEKKYVRFSDDDIQKVASTYHNWQREGASQSYSDIPEFCKSVSLNEKGGIKEKDFSLVPSKYIEFVNRDETVDYDTRMKELQSELSDILRAEAESRAAVLDVFKSLGYEIKL